MKKLAVVLYIVVLALITGFSPKPTFAAVPCQVIYGGGEVCQGQPTLQFGYPPALPIATPTPTPIAVPTTTNLPATGASDWAWVLIGLSGIGGVVLLLL